MSEVLKVGVDLNNNKLTIFDLADPRCRVEVDQVQFLATRVEGLVAEGYVTAVHGLPMEIADGMPSHALRALGVAPQLSPGRRFVRGAQLVRASAGDARFKRMKVA